VNLAPEGVARFGSIRCGGRRNRRPAGKEWEKIRGGSIGLVFQEPAAALDPVRRSGRRSWRPSAATGGGSRGRRGKSRATSCRGLFSGSGSRPRRIPAPPVGRVETAGLPRVALAGNPGILIADEPTTALDATVSAEVLELLDRLRRDRGSRSC
jgi:ABC-type dipeptide/oligopeptide/nickel transport system ATPase component